MCAGRLSVWTRNVVLAFLGVLVVALLLAPLADARRVTEYVTSGATEAELIYDVRRSYPNYSNMRVRIYREGETLINQRIPGCDSGCIPSRAYVEEDSVRVRDVDDNGEPEVLVDYFTGGANCCSASLLYTYRPGNGAYRRANPTWGRGGYLLRDFNRDGVLEFAARDARLDYRFSCTACNYSPPRTWHYAKGRLRDVTRRFPKRVVRDLRRVRRVYLQNRHRGPSASKGILPAYAADQCLLGHCRRGYRVLRRAAQRGEFRKDPFSFGPTDQAFVRVVKRFLRRAGYAG